MRVSADNWFGMMSHVDKVEAVNSFHSTLKSGDTSTMSRSLLNESQTVVESGRNLSIQQHTPSDGELQSLWSKASRLLSEMKVLKAPGSDGNNIMVGF